MSERLYCCEAPIDLSAIEHDDGTVEVEAKVLEVGRKVQKGGAGEFEIKPEHLEQMVRNHETEAAKGYEPPAVIGHPKERDKASAVGWIKGLRAAADGLYARVQFLKDFAQRVRAGEYRYSSPTFSFNWHDETGAERGAKLLDLGILNNPFQKSLGAFALSEITADAGSAQLTIPEVREALKETSMSKEIELTEKVANLTRDLTDRDTEIKALSESVTTLTDERDDLKIKLSEAESERDTLKEQVSKIQTEKDSAEIAGVLKVALSEGKFAPAQVQGHGTENFDGLKWLSESPFRDLAALKSYLKTAPPVVDLSERGSLGSGDGTDADRSARIEANVIAALAANPSLTRQQAVELAEANA